MKRRDSVRKRLFVCTKPYQYLICRLIKEGYDYDRCDLLVLNHFEGAEQFVEAIRKLGVWEQVFFEDDTALNKRNAQISALKKFLFYHNWKWLLPSCIKSYEEYEELYFAHEGVAIEYGLMRQFAAQGKPATIYEEGTGNYICVNLHVGLLKCALKDLAHLLDIPGSYIGRSRYVERVLLQRPEMLDKRNPVKRKSKPLPLTLREFLSLAHVVQEMQSVYPELLCLSSKISPGDTIAILLGESWWDTLPNKEEYITKILAKISETTCGHTAKVLIKQHPGEVQTIKEPSNGVELIPKMVPIELLYLIIKGKAKCIYLFSFASTALFNLYELLLGICETKVMLLRDPKLDRELTIGLDRTYDLADKFGVPYSFIDV